MNLNNLELTKKGYCRDKVNKITYHKHICPVCNIKFTNSVKNQVCCSNKCSGISLSSGYDVINQIFKNRGYTLLNKPERNKDKAEFICDKGHRHSILVSNFKSGQICGLCLPHISGYSFQEVSDYIYSFGYKLISNESDYVSSYKSKLKLICDKGHDYTTTFTHFKRGVRCFECTGSKKFTFSEIKNNIELDGYKVLNNEDDFISQVKTKINYICSNGHLGSISYRKWRVGQRCSKCQSSKEQKFIREYLTSIGIEFVENDRSIIKNKQSDRFLELDFWIPTLNKAIEYNGSYWHSFEDRLLRDEIKVSECDKMKIDLLVLDDYNFKDYKNKINNHLI